MPNSAPDLPPDRPGKPGSWSPDRIMQVFNVSRETLDLLEEYVETLRVWQRRVNLVGNSTLEDVWGRHVADCLQLINHAPDAARTWVDLGSGAGFPGIVLAIVLRNRPEFKMHLVDSNGRKCAFLRTVCLGLKIPAYVHHANIESLGGSVEYPRGDVVTARALAPLGRLIPLALPFMWKRSVLLLPKGRDVESELTQAAISSTFNVERIQSVIEPAATILRIERRGDGG
jgi:16S rRNA (guanine527-N7)-methyltransferase